MQIIYYTIEYKYHGFWSKHSYGKHDTIQQCHDFMKQFWPNDEYRIKQVSTEIVYTGE